MCGICGFVGFRDRHLIRKMTKLLAYRGPDDEGFYEGDNIALGQRRLSIIDLKTGKQPIYNENGNIVIVFNGEIYNYRELMYDLEKKGHEFKTVSDTEVIIHAYEEFGEACLDKLDGVFAFAIWDEQKKELFLARDRLGVKPLYYALVDDKLFFSSEFKTFLLYEDFPRKLDYFAMYQSIFLRYTLHKSFFQNVEVLKPGHFLKFSQSKKYNNKHKNKNAMSKVKIEKYWSVDVLPDSKISSRKALALLDKFMDSAVKKRLIADVPVGLFLSGGLDSSLILHYMKKNKLNNVGIGGDRELKTFSAVFDGFPIEDESKYSRFMAEKYSTNHTELRFDKSIFTNYPESIWHLEFPFEPTTVVHMSLAEAASKKIKVVLDGDGSDENFGGYFHHLSLNYLKKYHKYMPNLCKNVVSGTVELVPERVLNLFFSYSGDLGYEGKKRGMRILSSSTKEKDLYLKQIGLYDNNSFRNEKGVFKEFEIKQIIENIKIGKSMNGILSYELKTFLPNFILVGIDKLTMARSVETRVPFLDYKLVEFMARVPFKYKVGLFQQKLLLRRLIQKKLPKEIANRRKHAFNVPFDILVSGENLDIMKNTLLEACTPQNPYYNKHHIDLLFDNYNKSKLLNGKRIAHLYSLELWKKIFVESENINLSKNQLKKLSGWK